METHLTCIFHSVHGNSTGFLFSFRALRHHAKTFICNKPVWCKHFRLENVYIVSCRFENIHMKICRKLHGHLATKVDIDKTPAAYSNQATWQRPQFNIQFLVTFLWNGFRLPVVWKLIKIPCINPIRFPHWINIITWICFVEIKSNVIGHTHGYQMLLVTYTWLADVIGHIYMVIRCY
jgi:hypothetical protein